MVLIIAYGNSLRRDDGAGLVLAELLEEALRANGLEITRVAVHQLTPDLALSVAADDVEAVVFVDTRVAAAGDEPLELLACPLVSSLDSPTLGHQLGPSTLLTYARLLYRKSPPAWLLTVPGVDFDHGEGLSDATRHALDTLPDLLRKLPPAWPLNP
ncbi:MAG TPA: hydrogenase maturation protease [Syntrophobacteraceae bacterium]|nr:hydrogenase maturation protease [Syntrophobacteraceae bacterium]